MSVCQIEEKEAGRSYPRTCPTCGLRGACAKGLDRKGLLARIAALEAERDKLREALRKIREMPGRRWQRLAARAALAETEGRGDDANQ